MYILGINTGEYNSSACILRNGQIKFAIQEERLKDLRSALELTLQERQYGKNFRKLLSFKEIDRRVYGIYLIEII